MPKNRGENNSFLKQRNRGLLLKLIATQQHTSRIELSRATKLTKMTVTNIISEFIEKGLVVESTLDRTSGVGRNPIGLTISPKAPKCIGLQFDRNSCTAVLCDLKMNILKSNTLPIHGGTGDDLMNMFYHQIDQMLQGEDSILGIGVSALGPLNPRTGTMLTPPNFYHISHLPIAPLLKERYQLPVFMDNENNCVALTESLYGNGRDYSDFLFVSVLNGVGLGIISGGKLQHNKYGFAGELGHVSIDYNGKPCDCGNKGCVESYVRIPVIHQRLCRATGMDLPMSQFYTMSDNPIVDAIFCDMMDKLGCALVSGVNLLNPQAIVVGHALLSLSQKYIDRLENTVNQCRIGREYSYIPFLRPLYGNHVQFIGAACLAANHVFDGELLFG